MSTPEKPQSQPDTSGFSSADKLKDLGRGLKKTGLALGVTATAALGVHALKPGSSESSAATGPQETLVQSETTAPAEGTPADAEQLATTLKQLQDGEKFEVAGVIGSLQLGDTEQGPLLLDNGIVLPQPKDSDRIVIGGMTADGQEATYVLDPRHFAINLVQGESVGPVAQSYAEAQAVIAENTHTITVSSSPDDRNGTSIMGSAEDPNYSGVVVGQLRLAEPPQH